MESYSGLIGGSELEEGTRGRSFGGWLLSFNSNSELTLKVTFKLDYIDLRTRNTEQQTKTSTVQEAQEDYRFEATLLS